MSMAASICVAFRMQPFKQPPHVSVRFRTRANASWLIPESVEDRFSPNSLFERDDQLAGVVPNPNHLVLPCRSNHLSVTAA